jgi:hypothetical protein
LLTPKRCWKYLARWFTDRITSCHWWHSCATKTVTSLAACMSALGGYINE